MVIKFEIHFLKKKNSQPLVKFFWSASPETQTNMFKSIAISTTISNTTTKATVTIAIIMINKIQEPVSAALGKRCVIK